MVGHEEGVEIVVVAVERLVGATEAERHGVAPLAQQAPGQQDMLVGAAQRSRPAVHLGRRVELALEVKHHVGPVLQSEADGDGARHGPPHLVRHAERQVVADMAELPGARHGQLAAYAGRKQLRRCRASAQQQRNQQYKV